MIKQIISVVLILGGATMRAQVPADQLAKPPADAQRFTILSTAGTHGKASVWTALTAPCGRVRASSCVARSGRWTRASSWAPTACHRRSLCAVLLHRATPPKPSHHTWRRELEEPGRCRPPTFSPAFYVAEGGTNSGGTQVFIEALLKSHDKSMPLLPGGRARAEELTDHTVGSGPRC